MEEKTRKEGGEEKTKVEKEVIEEREGVVRFTEEEIKGYKVVRHMRSGGEGETYIVEKGGNEYVLKLYRYGFSPDFDTIKKIRDITHRYSEDLIILYEYGKERGRWYEIYEYCKLGNLNDVIKGKPEVGERFRKEEGFLIEFTRQIHNALKVLHSNLIYHRDLKPTNILVREIEPLDIVLTDFGIAKEVDVSTVFTEGFKGTFIYSAPETFAGQFTKKTDYWSLGVILYELYFGRRPFEGLSEKSIIAVLVRGSGEIIEIGGEGGVSDLMKGLLTREPEGRWGEEEVERFLRGERDIPIYYRGEVGEETDEWEERGIPEEIAKIWREYD